MHMVTTDFHFFNGNIMRLCDLSSDSERAVRLSRAPVGVPGQLQLKTYRQGGLISLSDAVPVLENFGFRVVEEIPTMLNDSSLG